MKPRNINIEPVLNGFVVHVGCQRVVITSVDELSHKIGAYYRNPTAMEEAYLKSKVNDTMADQPNVCEAPIRPEALRSPSPYPCETAQENRREPNPRY